MLNEVLPPAQMLLPEGSTVITTGTHVEDTFTVRVKVLTTQVPLAGVTV
jgi:hypothetical protein